MLLGASPQDYWKGFGAGTLHITCELFCSSRSVSRACMWLLPADLLSPDPWVLLAPAWKDVWQNLCQERVLRVGRGARRGGSGVASVWEVGRSGYHVWKGSGQLFWWWETRLWQKQASCISLRLSKAPVPSVCHKAGGTLINASTCPAGLWLCARLAPDTCYIISKRTINSGGLLQRPFLLDYLKQILVGHHVAWLEWG